MMIPGRRPPDRLIRVICRLPNGAILLIALLIAACAGTNTASMPQQLALAEPLAQPLSREELYAAKPVRPLAVAATPPLALSDAEAIRYGERLYAVNCAPCHRDNGEGNLHQFPTLNNNAFVTAQQPRPLIETVLFGRGVMPAFAPTLSAHDLAAVLSYVRNAWDNHASTISAAQIRQVEEAISAPAMP